MGKYAKRGFDISYDGKESNGKFGKEVNGDGGEKKWVQSVKERPLDKPFFMWFAAHDAHREWGPNEFSGTHDPSSITPPFYLADSDGTKQDLAKYYDEIKRFDHHIGEVVKELESQKVLENTLIIVMADNGRPFPHSKTRVNDRGMKTPFIVHWPNRIKEEALCTSLVSAIDIAPTIISLAGVEVSEQFQGHSFDKLLSNPRSEFRNYVFAEHNWHDYEAHERMVSTKDYMYILNSRPSAPQMGPADAVGSPSFIELVAIKEQGTLSAAQADIFMVPRPQEELYDRNIELQTINQKLELLSTTDQLTKLSNRHKMNSELEKELKRATRYKNRFSIITNLKMLFCSKPSAFKRANSFLRSSIFLSNTMPKPKVPIITPSAPSSINIFR